MSNIQVEYGHAHYHDASRYANKDVYMGFLKESQPHGHGELKKGRISSQAASIYTGEWNAGNKHGYGVLDEITKGLHKLWYIDFVPQEYAKG